MTRCAPELFQFILQSFLQLQEQQGAQWEPGLMLHVTLRAACLSHMFTNLQWGFRLAPNNMYEVIWEVCQAIVDELWDKFIVTPNTEVQWGPCNNLFCINDLFCITRLILYQFLTYFVLLTYFVVKLPYFVLLGRLISYQQLT